MFDQRRTRDDLEELKRTTRRILGYVASEMNTRALLERRIVSLEEKEKELFDRLMAKDYGEFILGRDVREEEINEEEISPEAQEGNAGEFLELAR